MFLQLDYITSQLNINVCATPIVSGASYQIAETKHMKFLNGDTLIHNYSVAGIPPSQGHTILHHKESTIVTRDAEDQPARKIGNTPFAHRQASQAETKSDTNHLLPRR